MFLYAVVKTLPANEDSQAWHYRAVLRGERETLNAGHYFTSHMQEETGDVRPSTKREIHWVSSSDEADQLARWLSARFPGTEYASVTVNGLFTTEVGPVIARRHVEGQGVLPV